MTATPDQPDDLSIEAFRRSLEAKAASHRLAEDSYHRLSEKEKYLLHKSWEDGVVKMEFEFPKALKACIDEDYGNNDAGIRRSLDPFRTKVLHLLREALYYEGIPLERTTDKRFSK